MEAKEYHRGRKWVVKKEAVGCVDPKPRLSVGAIVLRSVFLGI